MNEDDYTDIILRNHDGVIEGAWTCHFYSPNAFCAEMEAIVQALELAEELDFHKICFESDAMGFVLALNGISEQEDWRATRNMERGKLFFAHPPSLAFIVHF